MKLRLSLILTLITFLGLTGFAQTSDTISNKGHECVDMGLPSGTKWATCNIGADKPSDAGEYFAWAETASKTCFFENNCATYKTSIEEFVANPQYDAATVLWGEGWSVPTVEQMRELLDNCAWVWTTIDDKKGYMVTAENGNSIFLPAAGWFEEQVYGANQFGVYWTSTPYEKFQTSAYRLDFTDSSRSIMRFSRYSGQSIRAVTK